MKSRAPASKEAKKAKDAALKSALLDAAQDILQEEGYASASVRNIAQRVGLKHQAVFYYFGAQEDLLLALFQRQAEANQARLAEALNSPQPVRALFDLVSDPAIVRLTLEFMAIANHSEVIRAEIARNAKITRKLETDGLTRYFKARGVTPHLSPQLISVLTNSLARLMVNEQALGINVGHKEAQAYLDACLAEFEARGAPAKVTLFPFSADTSDRE